MLWKYQDIAVPKKKCMKEMTNCKTESRHTKNNHKRRHVQQNEAKTFYFIFAKRYDEELTIHGNVKDLRERVDYNRWNS